MTPTGPSSASSPRPPTHTAGLIEISDEVFDGHPTYGRLLSEAPSTGRCPVWITDHGLRSVRATRASVGSVGEIAQRDAGAVLAAQWFGVVHSGLTVASERIDDPVVAATRLADEPWKAHLALVPVSRPSDIPAAVGWSGPCNVTDDVVGLSAVLRNWEERFGALLVRVDLATLWLSVAAPPWTEQDCLAVAAEHFAFCRDVDGEDPRPLSEYAATLRGAQRWRFWWD